MIAETETEKKHCPKCGNELKNFDIDICEECLGKYY